MAICETNGDGAMKYVTSLRGSLDGMRFDVLMLPNGELMTKLIDDTSGDEIESLKTKMEVYRNEEGFNAIRIKPIGLNQSGTRLEWNEEIQVEKNRYCPGTRLQLTGLGYRGELYYLSAWWLMEDLVKEVTIEGVAVFKKNDEGMVELLKTFLGESKMEAFYGGEEVQLSDGLVLKVECDKQVSESDPELVDQKPSQYWQLAVTLRNENDYVAWLEGNVFLKDDGKYRLIINNWMYEVDEDKNEDGPIDNETLPDLKAFCARYMKYKFFDFEIMRDEEILEIDEREVSERTGFWLGF